MTPKDMPRLVLERDQNLLREADKVRTVLVIFAGLFLLATPAAELPDQSVAWAGLAVAALATLVTRFFVKWPRLEAQDRLRPATALVLMADLGWLMLFIAGTGGFASPFSMLLLVVILFAGIFFGSLPFALPLVTVTVVVWLTAAAAAYGMDAKTSWILGGQLLTAVALGWLCYALTEVLERERQTNAHVISRLNQGLLVLDDEMHLVMANKRADEILGLPLKDHLGRAAGWFSPQGEAWPLCRVLEDALRAPRQASTRSLELPSDPPRDLQVHTIPCRAGGQELVGWIVLMDDITDLKAATRMKEESLAIASHELRSPLAALQGVSHVLINLEARMTKGERIQMLHALSSEVQRLSEVVTTLLEASALQRESYTLETESVDPRELLNEVARSIWPRAAARSVEVSCELPPNLPEIAADRTRLRMALSNLAENALKYTPDGGSIALAARVEGSSLSLAVTDTGLGIPEEEREVIFDRFTRGSTSRGPNGALEGLGLGLYLTRRLVELHRGQITLRSEVGQGSTFEITLPFSQEPLEKAA